MGELVYYNAARKALADAHSVDEVKGIRDKALAMKIYAEQAKDTELVRYATEIKLRAERRAGEMLALMAEKGERAKGGEVGRRELQPATLADLGVTKTQSSRWQRLAEISAEQFEERAVQEIKKAVSVVDGTGRRVIAGDERETRRELSRSAVPLIDGMELRIGDCRKVLAGIADNSVALVLTDPPYPAESEPLYHWLAEFAARVLIPGGSLICYTGHWSINRDMRIFDNHLRYWWLLAMMHRQSRRLPGKFIIANFKPVLWYVKETRRGKTLVPDVLLPSKRDKENHDWGQGSGGIEPLIEHLTEPGELVVDPFAGTAEWGKITTMMGRKWIGSDIVAGGDSKIEAA